MSNSTVFVSNMVAGHDYSSAARFGPVRPVTSGNYPIFKTQRLTEEIIEALLESDPEDYLIISGSGLVAAYCFTVWLAMHKKARLLLFDKKQGPKGAYVPRTVTRDELLISIEQLRQERQNARL